MPGVGNQESEYPVAMPLSIIALDSQDTDPEVYPMMVVSLFYSILTT